MEVLSKLVDLVVRLYQETDGYIENPTDAQLWYNRGYANGMVKVLREQGVTEQLESSLHLDDEGLHGDDRVMAWAQAYHHGFEMGEKEAREVLPAA
ncbi:MAG: hypothetical protein HUJ29_04410 [Gammaproteobacteria bacterium]|nr:hypothetical protein [Gammaproteobacteria bacterium]